MLTIYVYMEREIGFGARLVCEEFNWSVEMGGGGKGRSVKQETEEEEITRLLLGIMEGYNDNVIPPLSYFSSFPGNSNAGKGSGSRKRQMDETLWTESLFKERKRREQISQKFSVLRSMVPTLFNTFKPSKEKIVGDTVDYINYLEAEIRRLEGLKKSRQQEPKEAKSKPPSQQRADGNRSADVTVSNGATFFAIQLPFRRGLLPEIVMVFDKHKAEILEAKVQVEDRRLLTFTATIVLGSNLGSVVDKIREELLTLSQKVDHLVNGTFGYRFLDLD